MHRILLLIVVSFLADSAFGQTAHDYTRRFEKAVSAGRFLTTFDSMIHQFHRGELEFNNDEVKKIIQVTRAKSYADSLLPAVFGWARTMFANGRVQEGLLFFMETADHYDQIGNTLGESVSYYEIAIIQHKAENLAEAEKYYRMAIDEGMRILPYRTNINCLNGIAMILRDRGDPESAAHEFRRALRIARSERDTAWIGILSGNIGSCHMAKENYDSSLWYYNENLFFIRKTGEFENEIETYANLGRVYIYKNDLKNAQLCLDSAVHIIRVRKINFNDFFNPMDEIHESYALLFSRKGDFEEAYNHFVKFHAVAEEKQRKINSRSLRQLESVWQFGKNQNEIMLLKKINQQQRYISWSFGVIILLLAGITLQVFRRARRRKKINRQLADTNSELGRLHEVKDMLFSVISHDLRGPIGNLRATLALLKSGNLSPDELAMLTDKLGKQLAVSGSALENVLHWAKAQLHENVVQPSTVSLHDLVASVSAQVNFDALNKSITITNHVDQSVVVRVDKDQMEVVIRNLLSNAVKFTPSGGTVTISAQKFHNAVTLCIHDTGVGMTPSQLKNLFNPNRDAYTTGTNQEKGTGIGLIIAREMVLANGGSISVESEKDRGTKFQVTLPD
jgi:signal transduction histidine kinase